MSTVARELKMNLDSLQLKCLRWVVQLVCNYFCGNGYFLGTLYLVGISTGMISIMSMQFGGRGAKKEADATPFVAN